MSPKKDRFLDVEGKTVPEAIESISRYWLRNNEVYEG